MILAYGYHMKQNEHNIEHNYAVGNKVSSYLEAGLPMIYHENTVFLDKLMNSSGLQIPFNEKYF